jgi:hypothetical protein
MTDTLSSFETSVLTRATRHNIPEDVILQNVYMRTLFQNTRIFMFHEIRFHVCVDILIT